MPHISRWSIGSRMNGRKLSALAITAESYISSKSKKSALDDMATWVLHRITMLAMNQKTGATTDAINTPKLL